MDQRLFWSVRDWHRLAAKCACMLAIAGCSSKSNEGTGQAPGQETADAGLDAPIVGCSGEGDTYSANMERPGKNGKYTFTLIQATPAPPGLDTNTWTLKVVDASGKSPAMEPDGGWVGTQVSAFPYMPKMGHGSSQVPQFAANPDGTFNVSDVYLFMDGLWTVTFTVSSPGTDGGAKPAAIDDAVYTFCIDG
jgi:hypothetical protein